MAYRRIIRPIVEFFPLDDEISKGGISHEIFNDLVDADLSEKHQYYVGVRKALAAAKGVYLFYDSRGRAIYAGKAVKLSLWREINNAYNRYRADVQNIKTVSHPSNNVPYVSSEERTRQIINRNVRLHEIAAYFSAYEITDTAAIHDYEALIIRAFANDLLNKQVAKFKT